MWRVTLDRMRADWPIVGAAWLITLLATSLLAAGPLYSTAVSTAGLHRVLADAPVPAANVEVSLLGNGETARDADARVSRVLREALGPGAGIVLSGESNSYALPGPDPEAEPDLTTLAFANELESHATLLDGAWPLPGQASGPIPVAVSEEIAALLQMEAGDELILAGRVRDATEQAIRIAAVYRIDNATDPFWWQDQGQLTGVRTRGSYRIIGPLFTSPEYVLRTATTNASVRLTWHAFPAFERLEVDGIQGLRGSIRELSGNIEAALPGTQVSVSTQLDALLADSERSLLVSRTGVLLLVVQLAVMAAYAIVLTAGLLVEHRRVHTSLLRSRGAGMWQVAGMALLEGILLAVPAVALAPWLATAAIQLLNVVGPLSSIGLRVEPRVALDAYLAASAAAIGCIGLLVLPTATAARLFAEEQGGLSRAETRTVGQRLGIDIALLAVTILGFWQLRLYGAPLTTSVRGTLGLDPLLVAAPAIGLLAGGVLALRIVPLLANLVQDGVSRGRDLVTALGAWQVARRPLRYTRAALLLMLAMSMGTFAVSYAATWTRSQQDQAGFQAGADVRVSPRSGSTPPWAQADAYRSLPDVEAAMPVHRQDVNLGRAAGIAELVALQPEAVGIVNLRPDLASSPLSSVLGELARRRPDVPLLALPERTSRMRIVADAQIDELLSRTFDRDTNQATIVREDLAVLDGLPIIGASVVLRDADGLLHRFSSKPVPLADGDERLTIDLASAGASGNQAWLPDRMAGPASVVAIDLAAHLPGSVFAPAGRVGLVAVEVSSSQGGDDDWQPLRLGGDDGWTPLLAPGDQQAAALPVQQRDGLALLLAPSNALPGLRITNFRPTVLSFVATTVHALDAAELPVVVNQAFAAVTGAQVGDDALLTLDGEPRRLRVVGTIGAFPTTDTGRPLALADEATLNLLRFQASRQASAPDEWWLRTAPGTSSAVAAAVTRAPLSAAAVVGRDDRARALSTDPVALGIIGALTVGFAVAGLFAVIGLAVSAAVSARERRTEFALLRALGLSSGQLSRWLWLENTALLLISLVAGTALGLAIAWAALPFVTVTQQGGAPVPSVIVEVPWTSIAVLQAVSLIALVATVIVLAGILRRIGIGSVLRMGED